MFLKSLKSIIDPLKIFPCCCSVTKSCLTVWDPMDCGMPEISVPHHLSDFAQVHAHWISDAIQPSHSLSSPSPHTFNLSSNKDFSNESVLCIRWPKYRSSSFNISPPKGYSGLIPLGWSGWISLQSKGLSSLQHHSSNQFFGAQLSLQSNSHIHTWLR